MNILDLYEELNAGYFAGSLPRPLERVLVEMGSVGTTDIDAAISIRRRETKGLWDADQDEVIGMCQGTGRNFTITISEENTPTLQAVRSVLLHEMIHLADGLRSGQTPLGHDRPFEVECRRICDEQGWDWTHYEGAPATFPALEKV